jgi:hypothetical protein
VKLTEIAAIAALLITGPAVAQQPTAPQGWPACDINRNNQGMGDTTPAVTWTMRLRAGGNCATHGTGTAGTFEVVNPPSHGVATVDGETVTYRAAAAYTGRDSFVLRFRRQSSGMVTPWFVTFNVEVR